MYNNEMLEIFELMDSTEGGTSQMYSSPRHQASFTRQVKQTRQIAMQQAVRVREAPWRNRKDSKVYEKLFTRGHHSKRWLSTASPSNGKHMKPKDLNLFNYSTWKSYTSVDPNRNILVRFLFVSTLFLSHLPVTIDQTSWRTSWGCYQQKLWRQGLGDKLSPLPAICFATKT